MNKKLSVFVVILALVFLSGCGSSQKTDVNDEQMPQASEGEQEALSNNGVSMDNNSSADKASSNTVPSGPVEITYIDRNGNQHIVDLSQLPSSTGKGGFIKSTGAVVEPASFQGPLLQDLADVFGGYTEEDALEITATDKYVMTLSKEQAQGEVAVYDEKGALLQEADPLNVMIALETDDQEMQEGMPRVVFVNEQAPITDGHFWVRNVAQIKIVPSVIEWNLNMHGITQYVCDRSTFESVANCHNSPHPPQIYEQENKSGGIDTYEGIALWVMLSAVDGNDLPSGHYSFNKELVDQGYTVQLYAEDGFMVELTSEEIAYNQNIILAYKKNGSPLAEEDGPLQLVGSGLPTKKHAIKNITKIELVDLP